jgi:hypothetical protein
MPGLTRKAKVFSRTFLKDSTKERAVALRQLARELQSRAHRGMSGFTAKNLKREEAKIKAAATRTAKKAAEAAARAELLSRIATQNGRPKRNRKVTWKVANAATASSRTTAKAVASAVTKAAVEAAASTAAKYTARTAAEILREAREAREKQEQSIKRWAASLYSRPFPTNLANHTRRAAVAAAAAAAASKKVKYGARPFTNILREAREARVKQEQNMKRWAMGLYARSFPTGFQERN